MKCEIIRDLLPSYIDGLTSNESNQEIEKHLGTCKECRECLTAMEEELPAEDIKRNRQKIKPFRKLKKVTGIAVMITVFVCILAWTLCAWYFREYTAASTDIVMEYEKVNDVVTLAFFPSDSSICLNALVGDEPEYDEYKEIEITRYHDNPFRPAAFRKNAYFGFTFIDKITILDSEAGKTVKLTGKENLLIHLSDTKIIIPIQDLYTAESAAKYGFKEVK